ncbi:hypothetical protein V8D89_003804 [Ganoderma adspersum]
MHAHTVLLVATSALACLTGVNLLTSYFVVRVGIPRDPASNHHHTYIGDDYPEHWPLPPAGPIALVVEDSSHYPILGPDAREEWASSTPKGFGYVRLGPEHRAFSVSLFHQYHCMRVLRDGLAGNHRPQTATHIGHCLVYLREMILCAPDLTLEPHDPLERDFAAERVGAAHVCEDWRQAYDGSSDNWDEWVKVRPIGKPNNPTHTTPSSPLM